MKNLNSPSITVLRVKGHPLIDGVPTKSMGMLWNAAIELRTKLKLGGARDEIFIPLFEKEHNCKLTEIKRTGAKPGDEYNFYPKDFEIIFNTKEERLLFILRYSVDRQS